MPGQTSPTTTLPIPPAPKKGYTQSFSGKWIFVPKNTSNTNN